MITPVQIKDGWCRHIPLLHRILADPSQAIQFPDVTREYSLMETCANWETLHYLLRDLLGWTDPGRGLAWWYANGKPVNDSPHLQLMRELWDRDQQLDYYAAWCWKSGVKFPENEAWSAKYLARNSMFHDIEWWAAFLRRPVPQCPNPYHGGGNPLHLGHSDWFGTEAPETDKSSLHTNRDRREAVLLVNHIQSWKRDLLLVEEELPPLGDRSWHVEVFDRQAGYLGLFRRSRETDRWFQGKHSLHIKGRSAH